MFGSGAVGVSFFFVLSGFVLTWLARPGETAHRVWRRRAAKIYPNHAVTWAVALAGMILLAGHEASPLAVWSNLALTQAWFPDQQIYFSLTLRHGRCHAKRSSTSCSRCWAP